MKKIPVIIDCDPGHDDMMALVLAIGSPALDVKLVTTVAGNKPLEMVTRNCLNVMHYIGADDIPIAVGCDSLLCGHKIMWIPCLRRCAAIPALFQKVRMVNQDLMDLHSRKTTRKNQKKSGLLSIWRRSLRNQKNQ